MGSHCHRSCRLEGDDDALSPIGPSPVLSASPLTLWIWTCALWPESPKILGFLLGQVGGLVGSGASDEDEVQSRLSDELRTFGIAPVWNRGESGNSKMLPSVSELGGEMWAG